MSTLAYAALTTRREQSPAGESVTRYVDAVAALVPAEVLLVHGLFISLTTTSSQDSNGNPTTTITEPEALWWAFWGLLALSVFLYVVPRIKQWDKKTDSVRLLIPPIAFLAWAMLQKTTAFDAVWPDLAYAPRAIIAVFIAVVIGALATLEAGAADQKPPQQNNPSG